MNRNEPDMSSLAPTQPDLTRLRGPEFEGGMEYVSCNLCGRDDTQFLFDGWDRLHGQPGRFRMVRCRQCGLIYLNPRPLPSQIGRYYPEDYPSYQGSRRSAQSRVAHRAWRYGVGKRLRAVAAFQPPGRLLDVGCADGAFVAFAREQGWDAYGVELNPVAAAFCRDTLNLPVITGDLLQAAYPPAYFDGVTLWSVLEHLHDPMAALREIHRILRPGGLVVLATPNPRSVDARLFGPAWVGYDMPRHLYIFPDEVLEQMLSQTGFRILERRCFFGGQTLFFLSLYYFWQDRPRRQWMRRWVQRLEKSWLVRAVTMPYFFLIDKMGAGPIATVFARRESAP
ncbi:MAG: class I SAM-dependent methyltransferase [Anaerolineae bacterium]